MHDVNFTIVLGALGFIINIIVLSICGTWALSRMEKSLREAIAEQREEIDKEFAIVRREFGETAAAIRQKVTDVELWGRDNFVRKETFAQVLDRIEKNIEHVGERLEQRLLRMETKIDKANGQ